MSEWQTYEDGGDPRALRDAMGCFATGVTVVTCADGEGIPHGLTANSFTSVSLDPPLLLVCLAKSATSAAPLSQAAHFAINVLRTEQRPASITFSTRGEDRFGRTRWTRGQGGSPLLEGSLAQFECAHHAVHDGGDHLILVGRIVRAGFEKGPDPLLYFRGKYRRLHFD
ncbi:flavin reductase family protein [Sphingomicrobium sp. XHP0239]|uniref:flavin reductase family protein n=1 Tax=Sphingomicrobium maritimum TaxID=3133972 RepID=UPI0031CCB50D